MKRTPLILTLGSLLFIAGCFFLYQNYFNKKSTSAWSIIPGEAVLVYEGGECTDCTIHVSETAIGKLLYRLADFPSQDSIKTTFDLLFSPVSRALVSVHIINKEDFDFIYYSPSGQADKFESLFESLRKIKNIKYSERVLNTIKIKEMDFGGKKFSSAQLNGIWVGSFTSFLIEDVIRTSTSEEQSSFTKEISEVYNLPKIKNDPGNVYIHLGNFSKWLGIFNESPLHTIPGLGQASLLDIKQNDNSLILNGFSLTRKNSAESLLSYFEGQSPVQFTLKQYFSNKTVFAVNYGINNGSAFYKDVLNLKNKSAQDSLASLVKIDYQKLYSLFGDELALCYQESKDGFSKVILFETSKPDEWLQVFDQLSKVTEMEDTIFYEKYSTYEIREIEIANLPGKLFGPLTSGFTQTYYASIGNTIILAEQLEQLKEFLNDIDQEDVWGKSVAINKFLESTLLESNVSIYINTPFVWSTLSKKLNPKWKSFITENDELINDLGMAAIQFSHLNESFYTNLALTYSPTITKGETSKRDRTDKTVVNFTSAVKSKPYIVRSHVSKDDEVLIQDSTNTLYHIESDGKVLWSKNVGGPIIGNVSQVDFYKNGKLQFFFATAGKLHIIDRLGNYVNSFPAEIRTGDIEYVKVIDYDNSKNYRFLIVDKSGKASIFDKNSQGLEGWRPKNLESGLFTEASHHRIRGKDYLIAIRKDGMVYLMNRRGENIKGFPLDVEARPEGDYYLEAGNSVQTTDFVIVSRDGFRIKFNLEGKILSKETLVKPTFNTQFSLIKEMHNKSYVIKRQDVKQLAILDEAGNELLVNNYVGMNPVDIKYYDFGAGESYISITDLTQDLTFVYNAKGKLITQTPIEGLSVELRSESGEMPKLFIVKGKSLIIQ